MKKKEICTVIRQKEIGDGIFSMWIQTENIGKEAKPEVEQKKYIAIEG